MMIDLRTFLIALQPFCSVEWLNVERRLMLHAVLLVFQLDLLASEALKRYGGGLPSSSLCS